MVPQRRTHSARWTEFFGVVDGLCAEMRNTRQTTWHEGILPGHRLPGCEPRPHHATLPSIYPPPGKLSRMSSWHHGPVRVSLFNLAPSIFTCPGQVASSSAPDHGPFGYPRLFGLVSHTAYLLTTFLPSSVFRPSVPACRPPFALRSSVTSKERPANLCSLRGLRLVPPTNTASPVLRRCVRRSVHLCAWLGRDTCERE